MSWPTAFVCLALSLHAGQSAAGERTLLDVESAEQVERMLADGTLEASECEIGFAVVDDEPALAVTTQQQFCDAFISLGKPVDFEQAGYLSFRLWVPADAWIGQVKFNFRDDAGNFGGFPRGFNHFDDDTLGQWIDVTLDLGKLREEGFANWFGEASPLGQTTALSINPFNADLLEPTTIYINKLRVHDDTRADYDFAKNVLPHEQFEGRTSFDFDDDTHLRRTVNRRAWEATYMAFVDGWEGNDSRVLRAAGPVEDLSTYLFNFNHIAGRPLDRSVTKVRFRYYLTEESAEIENGHLFLANEGWKAMLFSDAIFTGDLKRGQWTTYEFDLDALPLQSLREDADVRADLHEIRFDFKPAAGQEGKRIELYLDDLMWE